VAGATWREHHPLDRRRLCSQKVSGNRSGLLQGDRIEAWAVPICRPPGRGVLEWHNQVWKRSSVRASVQIPSRDRAARPVDASARAGPSGDWRAGSKRQRPQRQHRRSQNSPAPGSPRWLIDLRSKGRVVMVAGQQGQGSRGPSGFAQLAVTGQALVTDRGRADQQRGRGDALRLPKACFSPCRSPRSGWTPRSKQRPFGEQGGDH